MEELCDKASETPEGGDARQVAKSALIHYPQECQDLLHISLLDYLTSMARDIFKARSREPATDQPLLPGFPADFYDLLPRNVAVPHPTGRMAYKRLFGPHAATQDELWAGVTYLRGQILHDTKCCDALEEFWRYREYRGGAV